MKQSPFSGRNALSQARRVVVKLGTGLLCGVKGQFNLGRMESLVRDLAWLRQERQLVVVSSGAIGAGVGRLGLARRPRTIPEKQAAAAVGQCVLMQQYDVFFRPLGITIAQVLLTRQDIMDRERYLNARYTFEALLNQGVVPVVNENDTVAVEEIRFGDNDTLAAHVACLVDADLVILLTDRDGFYTRDPSQGRGGELLPEIAEITPEIEALAGGRGSALATGGMETKLQAARIAMTAGIPLVIASGLKAGSIQRVLGGEMTGTLFTPGAGRMQSRKHWIAFSSPVQGWIYVDQGAASALLGKGKSLLPSGILRVEGEFAAGTVVGVADQSGRELGRGISNYSSGAINLIRGHKSAEIRGIIGYHDYDEVIHRDNLTIVTGESMV
ncbi:MAG: glutamate 5-kinase [Thermacetogeniaceae bacterium]